MKFDSEQKIYDFVGAFLINQGKRSYDIDKDACQYRGPNGTKCAVGAVLSDHYYRKGMENISVNGLLEHYDIPKFIENNAPFFVRLQLFHDDPENWSIQGMNVKNYIRLGNILSLNTEKFEKMV